MVLLITGSTGMAEAAATLAASRGDHVFIAGLDESSCRELSARLPGSAYSWGDLREERTAEHALYCCLKRFGRLDGLFNVAGISGRRFGDGPLHARSHSDSVQSRLPAAAHAARACTCEMYPCGTTPRAERAR